MIPPIHPNTNNMISTSYHMRDGERQRTPLHVFPAVRIDHLVTERAQREVRPLRNEDELVCGGLAHDAAVHGPQPAQDPEERRLAAPVRPDDEQVLLAMRSKARSAWTIEAEAEDVDVGICDADEDGMDSPRA